MVKKKNLFRVLGIFLQNIIHLGDGSTTMLFYRIRNIYLYPKTKFELSQAIEVGPNVRFIL